MRELEQDCKFYKEVNAQLDLNQAELEKAKITAQNESQSRFAESEARIKDLEEQVSYSRSSMLMSLSATATPQVSNPLCWLN